MKRIAVLLVLFVGFACIPAMPAVAKHKTDVKATTVYITKTGKKYHRATCTHLAKSKIAISLEDAKKKGYTPCSRCIGGATDTR